MSPLARVLPRPRSRRLRVAVPWSLTRYPPNTSVDRIWSHGLDALSRRVDVRFRHPGGRRARFASCDAWLADGHQGPLPVRQPVVIHLHEASWDDPQSAHTLDPDFVARYREPSEKAARAAAQIITVSEHSRRQIVDAYDVDPERVHVVHNGVDLDVHRPGLTGGHDLVRRAGGDGDSPYILFVGTVHPRKNLPLLRRAVERLHADGLPHRLVVVSGPAPDRADSDELMAAATEPLAGHPVVNLAGVSEPDLARLMGGAAALCLPSLSEGFGMPVAEAMACGTPVVVADRGALPEVVGDTGVVVEPDLDSLVEGLATTLTDTAATAARVRAALDRAQRFDWAHMADGWVRVLEATGRPKTPDLSRSVPRLDEPDTH